METQRTRHDVDVLRAGAAMVTSRASIAGIDRVQIAQTMKRVGLLYALGLVVQLRIDGRQVLLPFLAAGVAWLLRELSPLVTTNEERRVWAFLTGSAWVVTALAFASLIPAVDPNGPTVVIAILFVIGTIAYVDLLRSLAEREGWADVAQQGRRAGQWLRVTLAVTVLLICAAYALVDPASDTAASDALLGRDLSLTAVLLGWAVFMAAWVPAMVTLRRTSRGARARLVAGVDGHGVPTIVAS